MIRLTLELPEERPFIRMTRQLGKTLLEELQVAGQDIDEVELIVGELCTNVVRHAHSDDHRFLVALEYGADRMVVSVQDRGPGFAPGSVAPAGTERADFAGNPERIGGYGLHLVEQLADHVEFYKNHPQGMVVRAEKRLNYRGQTQDREGHSVESEKGYHQRASGPDRKILSAASV